MNQTNPIFPSADTKKVFTLKFPVTYQNTTFTTLTLRRPKVKDTRFLMAKADSDPLGAQTDFLGSLAQVPPGLFEELDLEDMAAINAWVDSFTKDIGKN